MKKLLLIISIITPIYLFGQDSLFLKCIEFPGFGIKSSIELDDSLIVNIDNDNYNIQYLLNFQSLNFRDTTINNIIIVSVIFCCLFSIIYEIPKIKSHSMMILYDE